MKDIFISHSSKDIGYARALIKKLENEGFGCWASFHYEDINPGDNYAEKIYAAINSCKVFILLASINSLRSDQVTNEINLANNRKKYGLKLLGIMLDDAIDGNSLGGGAGYVFAANQLGYWNDEEYQTALLRIIHEYIRPKKTRENAAIVTQLPRTEFFVGRDRERREIEALLQEQGKVCLYGMGGIGKTALAKTLCVDLWEKGEYQNIAYIPVSNGLLRALTDDHNLLLEAEGAAKAKEQSDYVYGYYKLEALESGVKGKTLLVIDNLESEEDPLFSRILSLPCDLLICCRNPAMKEYTGAGYHLTEMEDGNDILAIFEDSYGRHLSEEEKSDAGSIFSSVRNHTLTIELLGKQLKYYGYTPSEYLTKGDIFARSRGRTAGTRRNDAIYEKLYELFDARALSKDEISVMKAMYFAPESGIPGHIIEELSGQECIEEIRNLKHKGWIQQDDRTGTVSLHPVVKEVVLSELGIDAEDKEIQVFTDNLISRISSSWDKPEDQLLPYKALSLAYYFRFQSPSIIRFNQYLTLARYFWAVNCPDLGIEIMDKIRLLFIRPDGTHVYSSQEAEAALQIGFIYQAKGEYKKAEQNLDLAARIFGNRYAAALSHLGQAKTYVRTETIETIEPLMAESLEIRERYWNGTLSEAASCHLYAKVLSELECKLEDALQYEKRADRLYSLKQPGGRNESSSKYILGWLYIQLSDGDEDLFDYGLELLEKAREIRIRNVGRYGIWMEDIYRKLGIAYDQKNDLRKAAFYFEELLRVAQEKYASDKANPVILEAHRYLERLYTQLSEPEKASRSRKYLRIYG